MRGHISKREGRPKPYRVFVEIPADTQGRRRQTTRSFRTRKEADQWLTAELRSLDDGTFVTPSKKTLSAYLAEDWLPTVRSRLKATTFDAHERIIKLHIGPRLGYRTLQGLTPMMVNTFYQELMRGDGLKKPLSDKTVRNVHVVLRKALADAVNDGLIQRNVAALARPPRPSVSATRFVMRVWNADEVGRFLGHLADDRLYALWHVAVMTGMRRGELLGLRWQDVDLPAMNLAVRQTLVSIDYKVTVTTPKSKRPRIIDLDEGTVAVLAEHHDRQNIERKSWGPDWVDSGYVFVREDGTPVHPDRLSNIFDLEVKRSGLPRIRLHDLRHTHATLGLQAGVPIKVMSERLGHATPSFTMDIYQHVMPGMQAEAAAQIAALVTPPRGPRPGFEHRET